MKHQETFARLAAGLACVVALGSCATLQQVMALRSVDFTFDRVANVSVAGVDVSRLRSYGDLGLADAARLSAAVVEGDVPLTLGVHLTALNPEDNSVDARLVQMDWTLLLEGRETVSGVVSEEILLPPGQPQDVAIPISLNLVEFFEGSARDLGELALSLAGVGGEPAEVVIRASPTVQTALGPIRYPRPLTLVRGTVGRE